MKTKVWLRWVFVAGGVASATVRSALAEEGTALVRHAPTLNGHVAGSVQVLTAENVSLNGGSVVTGDLLVPGTPTVRLNGKSTYGGTLDGPGAATPAGHQITLNGNVTLRHVVRRTDPAPWPAVAAPPTPAGTRSVTITTAGQSPGDFATIRHLTVNGNAGPIAVPPGAYGGFSANGGSGFVVGVAGATTPAVYSFQNLMLNGDSTLAVVGPVIVTVDGGISTNGRLGAANRPEWLVLRITGGGLTLNGGGSAHAHVVAPAGAVTLSGNSLLAGAVTSDRLIVNGNASLRLTALVANNQPPTAVLTAPANGSSFPAPAAFTLAAAATDADGTVTKVEFFQGAIKLGEDPAAPYSWPVVGLAAGTHAFTARATDDRNAMAVSAPITVTVTGANQPPTVSLVAPADGAVYAAPATIEVAASATDTDGRVARVDFLLGSGGAAAVKVGEATGPAIPPSTYTFAVPGVPPGAYRLAAQAHDDAGASTTSTAHAVTVRVELPYFTDFEAAEGYTLGALAGQAGWTASAGVTVSDALSFRGTRALLLAASLPPVQAGHDFPPYSGRSVVFVDWHLRPAAGASPEAGELLRTGEARVALVQAGAKGELYALNGAGIWQPTGATVPLADGGAATDWLRVTLREDFATQRWDLYANGRLVAADLIFAGGAALQFQSVSVVGHASLATAFDDFFAGFDHPLFVDADRDGLDDAWEAAHGLDPTRNDRDADRDGDGLSNLREYLLGTRPDAADSDGDGVADGTELAQGRDPTRGVVPDAAGAVGLRIYLPAP